jgi:ribonuclease R
MARKQRTGLPTREEILEFIESSDQPAGKREIAKAFGLSAQDKIALKALLRDMGDEGLIDSAPGRAFHKMGGVPKVTVLRIVDVDDGGNAWAVPDAGRARGPSRASASGKGPQVGAGRGDRVLARTEAKGNGFIAHPMKSS